MPYGQVTHTKSGRPIRGRGGQPRTSAPPPRLPARAPYSAPVTRNVSPRAERAYTAAYRTLQSPLNIGGLPSGVTPTILSDVLDASKRYSVDPALLLGQEQTESGFNEENYNSRNYAGAGGISQFIPSTGAQYGVRLGTDPKSLRTQIMGQAHYMHDLGVSSNPTEALNRYWGAGGASPTSYSEGVLQNAQGFQGALGPLRKRARAEGIVAAMTGKPTPGGGTGGGGLGGNAELAGKLAANRSGWQGFQGGPRAVRTAGDVIPDRKLNRWLTANGHDIEHLNPVLARHLIRLAKASGDPINVTSAYRSTEDQANISAGTNPKAPPGLSAHQFGMALDADFTDEQTQLAPRFGLEHGGAGPSVADPPHTELTDPRLIRKALKFGPVRSGYAPAGLPLSEGDLGNWSSGGTGAGVSSSAAVAGMASGAGGPVPVDDGTGTGSQPGFLYTPAYPSSGRGGIAASAPTPLSTQDLSTTLQAILGGGSTAQQGGTDPSPLAQILRRQRFRPRR